MMTAPLEKPARIAFVTQTHTKTDLISTIFNVRKNSITHDFAVFKRPIYFLFSSNLQAYNILDCPLPMNDILVNKKGGK